MTYIKKRLRYPRYIVLLEPAITGMRFKDLS